jgi:hypothetical protein
VAALHPIRLPLFHRTARSVSSAASNACWHDHADIEIPWRGRHSSEDVGALRCHLTVRLILILQLVVIVANCAIFAAAAVNPAILNDAHDSVLVALYAGSWLGVIGSFIAVWVALQFRRTQIGGPVDENPLFAHCSIGRHPRVVFSDLERPRYDLELLGRGIRRQESVASQTADMESGVARSAESALISVAPVMPLHFRPGRSAALPRPGKGREERIQGPSERFRGGCSSDILCCHCSVSCRDVIARQ